MFTPELIDQIRQNEIAELNVDADELALDLSALDTEIRQTAEAIRQNESIHLLSLKDTSSYVAACLAVAFLEKNLITLRLDHLDVSTISLLSHYIEHYPALRTLSLANLKEVNLGALLQHCQSISHLEIGHLDDAGVVAVMELIRGDNQLQSLVIDHLDEAQVRALQVTLANSPTFIRISYGYNIAAHLQPVVTDIGSETDADQMVDQFFASANEAASEPVYATPEGNDSELESIDQTRYAATPSVASDNFSPVVSGDYLQRDYLYTPDPLLRNLSDFEFTAANPSVADTFATECFVWQESKATMNESLHFDDYTLPLYTSSTSPLFDFMAHSEGLGQQSSRLALLGRTGGRRLADR